MRVPVLVGALLAVCQAAAAGGWRGDGSGSFAAALPTTRWSAERNVVWKAELPQRSNASPVIAGERIFVCAEPATILCLARENGAIVWQAAHPYASFLSEEAREKSSQAAPELKKLTRRDRDLGRQIKQLKGKIADEAERKRKEAALKEERQKLRRRIAELKKHVPPRTHGTNGHATPTPACDGRHVVVVFGTGVAACHDVAGEKKWARIIGRPTHGHGHSTSPVITGGKAIIKIADTVALDVATGDELWSVPGKQVFGSVVHARVGGKDLIVTAEGQVIDADDGRVLAKGLHKLAYCSPIVHDGVAYFIEHGGKAVRLPAGGAEAEVLWKTQPRKERYYASPLHHDGLIYAVTRYGVLSVIDATDGTVVHSRKLKLQGKAQCYASVTFAGGHVLVGADNGQTLVLRPGREAEQVGANPLEPYRSSPVFDGRRMYVRARRHLYCIAASEE
jgi:hypothetical protein